MFNLSRLVNTIETDRRSKIVQKKKRRKRSAPEIIKAPKPETKDASTQTEKKQFAIDMECVTRALSVCANVSLNFLYTSATCCSCSCFDCEGELANLKDELLAILGLRFQDILSS